MKKFLYILSAFLIFVNSTFFCFGGEWDWTEGFFDVDEKFEGEEYEEVEDQKEFKSEVNNENFQKDIKEGSSSFNLSALKSSQNSSYSLTDIPFFDLQVDYSFQYDLLKSIFNGTNKEFTCLVSVTSSAASFFICQYGVPYVYFSRISGTEIIRRIGYGAMMPAGVDIPPSYYMLRYTFSSGQWSNFTVSEAQNSVFGWNFNSNITGSSSSSPRVFSVFSNSKSNWDGLYRDIYFFGFPFLYADVAYQNGQVDTEYFLGHVSGGGLYDGYIIKTLERGSFSCGNSYLYFPFISDLTWSESEYLYNSDFSFSQFKFEDIREYPEDFSSSFDDSIEQFISDTNDFISRINLSKTRVTGYISDFFNVFDADHIPRPLYFIILFLIICAVLVGVFT